MTQESMNLVVFDPIKARLAELEERDKSLVFDHTTPEGEKGLRSWVKEVRGYKGDVARAHKDVKAEALRFGRQVDAIKNELTAGADKLIKERMKPLDEIEAKKRAEAEAIVQAEEDAKLAKEAAEKTELERREAEVAKKEAEIREIERVEREKRIAAEATDNARKEAERVAANRAKVAEQEKTQAIENAKREKAEAIEAEKEKARKLEAERIAENTAKHLAEQTRLKKERERVANKKHREGIEYCVQKQLDGFIKDVTKTNHLMDALKAGRINHLTINY